jgi:hypothetical protein
MLLDRLAALYKKSGQAGHPRFDEPFESHQTVIKLHGQVFRKWQRKATEPKLHKHYRRRLRHPNSRRRLQVVKNDTSPMLRAALPKVFMQGFLKTRIAVYPYRSTDTFLGGHRVNVFKHNSYFDVIDALCNIPILSGISEKRMREVVEW